MDLFELAARKKFRFESPRGLIAVEDLWDLPLSSTTGKANLNDIAIALHKQLKETSEVSFVDRRRKSTAETTLQARFDIVKYILDKKMEEADAESASREKAERKQKILGLIQEKQEESLRSLSVEDLQKMLAD